MSTHGQSVRNIRDWCIIVGLRAGDRYLVVSPFFHTFGYRAGILAAPNAGATPSRWQWSRCRPCSSWCSGSG